MPSFEEIHSRDVSGKTYSRQRPGVLQEAQSVSEELRGRIMIVFPLTSFFVRSLKIVTLEFT